MVAGESATARALRSSTAASVSPSPALPSRPMASRSICQMSLRSGSRSRTDSTAASCAGDSTRQATAPESPRIHWICSGELVSYTGTVTAPALQTAKSSSVHSYRVRDISPTRSPGRTPEAISPFAAERTSARKAAALTSCQRPSTLRPMTVTSGRCAALRRIRSVRLPSAGTSYRAGRLNSRKTAAPRRAPAPLRRRGASRRLRSMSGRGSDCPDVTHRYGHGIGVTPRCSLRHTTRRMPWDWSWQTSPSFR